MYATDQDIIARYSVDELAGIVGTDEEGRPLAAPLAQAIADATAEIDLALRGRYELPLPTPTPSAVTGICVALAMASLPRNAAEDGDLIQARAKDARKLLAGLASGSMVLDAPQVTSASSTSGDVLFDAPPPRLNLEGF